MARWPSNMRYRPSAFTALPIAWGMALLILGWLVWLDYQQNVQHQQSLARQAAHAGAQGVALYFQDVTSGMLQISSQESDLLDQLNRQQVAPDRLARLESILRFRYPTLEGYAITGSDGRPLTEHPSGYLTSRPMGSESPSPAISPSSVRMREPNGQRLFDLGVPWFHSGDSSGTLLVTLSCDFLCSSLQARAPVGHLLTMANKAGADPGDWGAAAPVPGTSWRVIDRIDRNLFSDRLLQSVSLALVLLALFVVSSLLLYSLVKRKNRVLADDSERYRELFHHAGMAVLLVDAEDGRILDASQAAGRLFRLTAAQLCDSSLQTLLNMQESRFRHHMEQIREGHSQRFSAHFMSAGSTLSELEVHASGVDTSDFRLVHVAISDVTERMRSLRALRENEEKLRAILDASSDGVLMTNKEGLIQVFSPAAEMMFGFLREEIVNRPLGTLMPNCFDNSETSPKNWFPANATAAAGAVRETAGMRKNGEEIPIRVSLSQVSLSGEQHYVALIQDLTEQRRNEAQLNYLEHRDILTGLLNRQAFERRLDALLSFSEQGGTEYVLCYIDMDQFKIVNDTCGHTAGDELLKQLAILIKSHLGRESDAIARMGGDEFGALLADCTVERGEDICNALMQTIRNFLFTWQDQSFDVAVSIGIASFRPHVEDASQVLSQADVACHMAKRMGRDRVHVYHQGDVDLIRHHDDMRLVSTINQALNEERFHLYAQPIVPVSDGKHKRTHYEVLVRMVDAQGIEKIPDNFIPAAERYILMPAIDRWVINRLFSLQAENLREWARVGNGSGYLFGINLSGTSLTDDGFLNYLKRQFTDFDIPYHSICFEITETAAVANLERAKHLIEELKDLGCSFALDDFGTGLSSYSYLKLLPVDYLKIDGSFVRNMTEDPVDYAMVDSINQIGHILGLQTIAEWAENLSTFNQLRALNVDFAQGYGVGDMISVEDFRLTPPSGSETEDTTDHEAERSTY